jgi:hypothetical protein
MAGAPSRRFKDVGDGQVQRAYRGLFVGASLSHFVTEIRECHYFDDILISLSDERKIANLLTIKYRYLWPSDFTVPLFFARYHRTIAAPSRLQARV